MAAPRIPACCLLCTNFNKDECICPFYDYLPGECTRESVVDCPSFLEETKEDSLKVLAKYIDEDPDRLVEKQLDKIVSNIITGYENKYKIMVVGVARRKIKAMVKMVDIIDIILNRLSTEKTLEDMSTGQTIRLLSELNQSINNDLTFVMKLVNPDTQLRDLQMWVDARSFINVNGSSKETDLKTEEILSMTSTSRDKIREAFDTLLHTIDVEGVEEEYVPTEGEKEEIELL